MNAIRLTAPIFGIALLLNSWANAEVVKTPCSELKEPPVYASYGIKTPGSWTCVRAEPRGTFVLTSEGKMILASIDKIEHPASIVNDLPDPQANEPLRTIRLAIESFLGDEKVINRSEAVRFGASYHKEEPKAVLFGKENKQVVVYTNLGLMKDKSGTDKLNQVALIYKDGQSDKYLTIGCMGCTPDEFFSLVINPAIQK